MKAINKPCHLTSSPRKEKKITYAERLCIKLHTVIRYMSRLVKITRYTTIHKYTINLVIQFFILVKKKIHTHTYIYTHTHMQNDSQLHTVIRCSNAEDNYVRITRDATIRKYKSQLNVEIRSMDRELYTC